MKALFLFVVISAGQLFGQSVISQNQPVTASSFQSGNYPTNGNDGNLSTRWAASDATFPQWWQVDLGSSQTIGQAVIYWYSYTNRAYQYQIQISEDGANFSVLVNNTNNLAFGITTNTFSALARYVRVYVTGCSASGGYAGFYECQIFGAYSSSPSPHTPDANTLFLFHLDEAAGGSVTTNLGSAGGNAYTVSESVATTTPPVVTDVLGAAGYPGFGNAATFGSGELIGYDNNHNGVYDGDASASQLSADSFPMSSLNMGNGGQTPWTLEALIDPSAINVANQEIICTDSSAAATANRGFQFRLNAAAQLELNLIGISGADIKTAIPTTATDPVNGFVPNNWYHVAATYDGTNVVLYWTKLSASAVAAHPISTNAVAVGPAFGAVPGPLGIGNRTRSPAIEYFQGLIDEVRISNIVRTPADMINTSSAPAIGVPILTPANNPVYAGTSVTLSAAVSGVGPLYYFWQTDGASGGTLTNIPGANSIPYTFDTTGWLAGDYQFDLMVTNSSGAAASVIVAMNLTNASGPVLLTDTVINPVNCYAGSPVLMSAAFTGNQPISYQWFFNNAPVAGATNNTYSVASAQLTSAGSYFLVASNNPPGLGSQTAASTPATLSVVDPPTGPTLTNTVSGLRCEFLDHPELTVITSPNPRFGWGYQPFFRNDSQSSYRIIVASTPVLAAAGTGDLWDTGWVLSSSSLNVPYAGTVLQPNTSYYWAVQTVNSLGQIGALSAVQQFNTASQLSNPLTTPGVVYQQPSAGSANCNPIGYVAVPPVLITTNSLGHVFIDFGNDAFGYATVHINGNYSGTTVSFGLGELAANHIVNTSPGATIRYWSGSFALQNGNFIYTNRSTTAVGTISPPTATYGIVSPFRYLELSGLPAGITLTTNDVTQWRLQSEFDDSAATFNSSSPALNQVWGLCKYSMKALSFDGIYVDGDRERTPYEADTYIHMLSSYGVNNDFTTPRCTFEYLTSHLTWPTEWPMHMVFVAWADYQHTGDPYLMTKYYSFLTNSCLLAGRFNAGSGLVQSYPETGNTASGDIIDWYRISGDGIGNIDGYVAGATNAVINAFYFRCMTIMTDVAQLTGHPADAAVFAARAGQVYTNYNNVFWDSGSQSYIDSEGTTHSSADANFFPLAFGLVPANNQTAVVNYIHSRIAAKNGMPAGVYGAQYLLEGLFRAGDANTALGLMTTNNARSWLNMINSGSTITDEAWSTADKSNEDWNHAWGAAPGNLIPRYVLGLRPLAAGYGQVLIQPQLGTTLSFVQGTVPTIRGPVTISVTNAPGQYQLLVNIPGNVTATIMLPAFGATNPVALVDGAVVPGTLANNWLTVTNIGSGQHAIWLSTNNAVATATLYNNWAAGWFGTNAANPAIAGQTADPDGDGFNNYSEFIAGTDPTNPNSHFSIDVTVPIPSNALNVLMTVNGAAGRSYILQRTSSLTPPVWTGILTNATLVTNQTLQFSDPQPPSSQAYYRVLVTLP